MQKSFFQSLFCSFQSLQSLIFCCLVTTSLELLRDYFRSYSIYYRKIPVKIQMFFQLFFRNFLLEFLSQLFQRTLIKFVREFYQESFQGVFQYSFNDSFQELHNKIFKSSPKTSFSILPTIYYKLLQEFNQADIRKLLVKLFQVFL